VKRSTVLILLWLPLAAFADEPALPQGYAFDQPEVLADQRLWGIAHGVRLLALACVQAGKGSAAEAWVDWQEREAVVLEGIRSRLAMHYFKHTDKPHDAITAALGLAGSLGLTQEMLLPACETLADALGQPRYELLKRREELLKP
jgi:hypothetical protein